MGSSEDWHALWLEKTSRVEPAPILSPWDALLRHAIEPAIMDFYEHTFGRPVTCRGELVVCPEHPILRCTLDGADMAIPRVVDAKLLNTFTPNPVEWARGHYAWQMVHQMVCKQVPDAWLYVSIGMAKPTEIVIEYDEFEAAMYIDRAKLFWSYVEQDKEPPGAPPPAPAPIAKESMRTVDMQGNNLWADLAGKWLDNRAAAKTFDDAIDGLKKLVDKDVKLASGHGIAATRSGRGVSIKEI